jgi:hypothetical protein
MVVVDFDNVAVGINRSVNSRVSVMIGSAIFSTCPKVEDCLSLRGTSFTVRPKNAVRGR